MKTHTLRLIRDEHGLVQVDVVVEYVECSKEWQLKTDSDKSFLLPQHELDKVLNWMKENQGKPDQVGYRTTIYC